MTIQVLTQARPELIARTFESLRGAPRPSCTSTTPPPTLQRRVVFGIDRPGIVDIAVRGARAACKEHAERHAGTRDGCFEYTPESFTGTELDFAVEICDAVMRVWEPTPQRQVILNLPATVEMATPNVYADQIEWFAPHIARRDSDRHQRAPPQRPGHRAWPRPNWRCMAGADRVEGTLFGNGERTGNVDVVTLALNLYTQGVDPGLDFSDINEVGARSPRIATSCRCIPATPMPATWCSPRSPAPIRTPSRRVWRPSQRRDDALGRALSADRPEATSGAPTTRSSGSTASRARAASPIFWRATTARSCPGGCRSNSARLYKPLQI